MQYLIMCRSLTYAQRTAALLERSGIPSTVVKAPQGLTSGGCGYAVSLYKRFEEAVSILRANSMVSGKLFRKREGGEYKEVRAGDLP